MNERSLTPSITVTIGHDSRIYFAFVTTAPADLDSPATLTLHAASLADVAGFAAEPLHPHATLDQALAATMDPQNAVELPPLVELGALKVNATVVPSPRRRRSSPWATSSWIARRTVGRESPSRSPSAYRPFG